MKKRRFITFVVLAVCLLIGISVALRRSRESITYRGQPLKAWSMQAYQGNSNAVATLKELGTNAIPELIQLLKTRDSFLRKQTWTHLPRLPLRLRQKIARRFPPPQAEVVREAAARALGRLGPDAKIAIPALSQALRDNQGRVRWEAGAALGLIGKDSVPALIKALDENDAKARHATAYALGQIGPDAVAAVPALLRRLSDQDQAVRNSAAYSLTTIGTIGILALIDTVKQGQRPACESAANTLTNSYLPSLKVTREFFKMAKSESAATRQRAIEVLGTIRPVGSSAILASIEALEDPMLEVRLAAIKTIGARAGTNQKAVKALTHCLKDESPITREAAAQALGNIGPSARAAVPELARLAEEKEESVSVAAKVAMGKIGESESHDGDLPQH